MLPFFPKVESLILLQEECSRILPIIHISHSFYNIFLFQAQSIGDLTGSRIVADRPIAVFSGNIRTKVALSASRDHVTSQLLPVDYFGTEFLLVPTAFRLV